MQEMIIEVMNQFGYLGVALLIMIENIFPPIPSEVILTFGGFMTTYATLNVWGVILAATIGSVLGALALFYVGRILNAERLERLVSGKIGHALRLKKEDIAKADAWFDKHGNKAVFFGRFVPIVRSLISLPAGFSDMKLGPFLTFTASGTLIWNIVLVWAGRFAGGVWEKVAHLFDIYSLVALVALVVIFGIVVLIFIKKRFLKKPNISK
ncbi:MAG: DedA family protein [Candidatus Nomurabacteria bacterium]|jgi:membrane protein DedA with SNARE-associated domain|nr:DedA family protein [Candidatus Nomurabacteria bacterium]